MLATGSDTRWLVSPAKSAEPELGLQLVSYRQYSALIGQYSTHPELVLELLGDWLIAWDRDLALGSGEAGPVWCLRLVNALVTNSDDQ